MQVTEKLDSAAPISHGTDNPQEALVAFVRALAKRQARFDAGIQFVAANDNNPVVKH